MDYKKHIKELEVYFYFDAHTIPQIVEPYYSLNGSVPSNITKREAIWALMEWLYDNAWVWYGANIGESVEFIKETTAGSRLEEGLEMKEAYDLLENMYEGPYS
jgi:hypothetical protein